MPSSDMRVSRIAGIDRYATSLEISRKTFSAGECTAAVLVSGAGFADALSASGLAGAVHGPIILCSQSVAPAGTLDEFHRLGVTTVFVVGGTGSISDRALYPFELGGLSTVRLAGANRFDTSARVAEEVARLGGEVGTVYAVSGYQFADGLSVSPLAFATRRPVLLTLPDSVPGAVSSVVASLGVQHVQIVGGTAAVGAGAVADFGASGAIVERIAAGLDRYATAVQLANRAASDGALSWSAVGISQGLGYQDALSGSTWCGSRRGMLLLTNPRALSAPTASALKIQRSTIAKVAVFGGSGSVSASVVAAASR